MVASGCVFFVEGWLGQGVAGMKKDGRSNLLIYDARFRTFGPPFIHELVGCDF